MSVRMGVCLDGQVSPMTFMVTVFFRGHSVAFALRWMKFTSGSPCVVSVTFTQFLNLSFHVWKTCFAP